MKSWILDSGAFSAWTKGVQIDLNEYVAYFQGHRDDFRYLVNLDTIPPSSRPTAQQALEAAEASFRNYCVLKEALGADSDRLIPVYHQGEDITHLTRYLDQGAQYIALSPVSMGGDSLPQKIHWLREVSKYLPPDIKTHALGLLTLTDSLTGVLTSMDASSWARPAAYGTVLLPSSRGWKLVHVTSDHTTPDAVLEAGLARTRELIPDYPEGITAQDFRSSYRARAFHQLKVIRHCLGSTVFYAPQLLTSLCPVALAANGDYLLASFWFLRQGTGLLKAMRGPVLTGSDLLRELQTTSEKSHARKSRVVRNGTTGSLFGDDFPA